MAMGDETEEAIVHILRTGSPGNTSEGYVFQNKEHAKDWMAQGYVKDAGYRVEVWRVKYGKPRTCCGHRVMTKIKRLEV